MANLTRCLALAALLAPLLLLARPASADCAPYPIDREIEDAALIVEATLVSADQNHARFAVRRVFKGDALRSVTVSLNPMRFYVAASERGQTFALFLRRAPDGSWRAIECGNSGRGARVPQLLRTVERAGHRPRPVGPRPPG